MNGMNGRFLKILASAMLIVVFSFSQAFCADVDFAKFIFRDAPFVLKLNVGSMLSMQKSLEANIPSLKKAQEEIQTEIEKRTGMVITRDVKYLIASVGPEINVSGKKPNNILIVLTGSFNAEKITAEISKEKKVPVKIEKKDGIYRILTDKNFQGAFLNESVFVFGSDDAVESAAGGKFKSAELSGETRKIFDESNFFMSFNTSGNLKEDLLKNMGAGTPPIASILLKSLRGLLFFDKYPALVLKAEFSEKTAADDFKKLIDSFKNMAEVMMSAKEKEEDEKISRSSALELLNPELLGMKAALGAGKTLISAIETTTDGSFAELKIKVPDEFQAFLKPGHLPVIAGVTGVLAAIAIPNFTKARNEAQRKACKANMMTIEGACELYQMESGTPAAITVNELVDKGYMKNKPVCRAKKDEPVEYKITIGESFDVECPLHGKLSEFSK